MKKLSVIMLIFALACGCTGKQNKNSSATMPFSDEAEKLIKNYLATRHISGMVNIVGGTFTMGSPAAEPERNDDEVQHIVTLSSFSIGKYPVTQREYQEILGTNTSNFTGDDLPVERVSWYEAVEYCNRRSQREGLTPVYVIDKSQDDPNNKNEFDYLRWLVTWNRDANGYRLPTEAEWEYACRAGTTSPFFTGNNITSIQANYDGNFPYNNNAKEFYWRKTTPVGIFESNLWGLYDMHGNVSEWCWDWYGSSPDKATTDPEGAVSGTDRIIRGGSWSNDGKNLRSAYRFSVIPTNNLDSGIGFRVVRDAVR